jgi:hypothetical protein
MALRISTVVAALGLCLGLGCAGDGDGGEQTCVPACELLSRDNVRLGV